MIQDKEHRISLYLYLVLLVSQSGMQLPFLSFMSGNNQFVLAGIFLFVGYFLFSSKNKLSSHSLGMNLFAWLSVALVFSIIMAYLTWQQDIITSIFLYRLHIWIFYLPLFLYIKPSVSSISDALFMFTLTALGVWIGQSLGFIQVNFRESIWGEILDERSEFGGYSMYSVRLVSFSLYLFLWEMTRKFTNRQVLKVLIALTAVMLSSQRAMMLFAIPITAYVFLFKLKLSVGKKTIISLLFGILAFIFFFNTTDVWLSFINETTEQLSDKDYNRWLALDYFINRYNEGVLSFIFGNGCLSLKNAGGQFLHDLGYMGIFIEDVGMLGVWVRYGLIPLVVLYYIVIKVLFSKQMPLYMKLVCIHIGFLPTSWTLIGTHWFVFIFLIYLYCINVRNSKEVYINKYV